jgi:GNAT superfamily N-acetyltransferase
VDQVRLLGQSELDGFLSHAEQHARESGDGTTVRFAFRGSADPWDGERIRNSLAAGLKGQIGSPGWCRVWIADGRDGISGHVGLRAHPDSHTSHRALVSIGVLAPHRRQGLGARLLEAAIRWAADQGSLEWLDSEIFGHNEPSLVLHLRLGFVEVGRMVDMYRLDGTSIDNVHLALRLRGSEFGSQ